MPTSTDFPSRLVGLKIAECRTNEIQEDVKRRKLEKTLGRSVLSLRSRDAMATTNTLGDKDNARVSTTNKNAEDSCRYLWKLWMSMGRESSSWSLLLENEAQ